MRARLNQASSQGPDSYERVLREVTHELLSPFLHENLGKGTVAQVFLALTFGDDGGPYLPLVYLAARKPPAGTEDRLRRHWRGRRKRTPRALNRWIGEDLLNPILERFPEGALDTDRLSSLEVAYGAVGPRTLTSRSSHRRALESLIKTHPFIDEYEPLFPASEMTWFPAEGPVATQERRIRATEEIILIQKILVAESVYRSKAERLAKAKPGRDFGVQFFGDLHHVNEVVTQARDFGFQVRCNRDARLFGWRRAEDRRKSPSGVIPFLIREMLKPYFPELSRGNLRSSKNQEDLYYRVLEVVRQLPDPRLEGSPSEAKSKAAKSRRTNVTGEAPPERSLDRKARDRIARRVIRNAGKRSLER